MKQFARVLVTGGAGFIGSAFIRHLSGSSDVAVVNVDKLSYASDHSALDAFAASDRYKLERVDICNRAEMQRVFREHQPEAIVHLAAETHVDRSIDAPADFISTNIMGTYTLLEVAMEYWKAAGTPLRERFRFHHVSTDEVFGSLTDESRFTERSPYQPNSPYSASKAASDHLVRAWHHTFGLPVLITNCSNNYGPYQFPEKLIPLMILSALRGKPLPVYGDGGNVRDWLFVDDHARALALVLQRGQVGETYNIGGDSERTNLQVVETLCGLLDAHAHVDAIGPRVASYREQIKFVPDRPGHDRRYAIDATKMKTQLGWTPVETFESGLRKTVEWYLSHAAWCDRIAGRYDGQRLGLGT